jgi:hypothetical protein
MAQDMDLYKATLDQKRPKGNPDLVEFGLLESLMTSSLEVLQQIRDFTAGAKKSKPKPLPRPITAEQRHRRELAKQAYADVMSILRFPDEQGGE